MGNALAGHFDCILLWHGLALVLLAGVCLDLSRRPAQLPWGWFGSFALAQAIGRWLDLLALSMSDAPLLQLAQTAVMAASYVLLIEFGRRAWQVQCGRAPGSWLPLALLALAVAAGLAAADGLRASGQYVLGLPAEALAGWVILRGTRRTACTRPRPLVLAALVLWAHGLTTALAAAQAHIFPSALIDAQGSSAAPGPLLQLFQALCIVALAAVLSRAHPRKADEGSRYLRGGLVGAALLLLLACGWWAANWCGRAADQRMRSRILAYATRIADTIEPQQIKALSFTIADKTRPEYQRLRRHMIAFGQVIRQRSIYSMALRDGHIVFGPENIAADDPLASPPGTVYEDPAPGHWKSLQTGKACTEGPYTDEYGTFVSGIAPVRDPRTGQVLMTVGLDILADRWQTDIARHRLTPIAFTLGLALILLLGHNLPQWHLRMRSTRGVWTSHADVVLTGTFGLVLTAGVALLAHYAETDARRATFTQTTDTFAGAVVQTLCCIRDEQLGGLAHFLEANENVARESFQTFTRARAREAAIWALAWAPRILAADVSAVQTQVGAEGLGAFTICQRDSQGGVRQAQGRDQYYPILYMEPLTDNEKMLGLDLGAAPGGYGALEDAARTRLPTATDLLALSPQGGPQRSLWVYQPVFPRGSQAAAGEGAARPPETARGFAVAILSLQSVLDEALAYSDTQSPVAGVELFALKTGAAPQWLASWPAQQTDHPRPLESSPASMPESGLSAVFPIFMFGKAYALAVHPERAFLAAHPARAGWVAGLVGLVLVGGVTGLVGVMSYRRAVWQREAAVRTAALEATQQANEAICQGEARAQALLELSQMTNSSRDQSAQYALEAGIRLTNSTIGYIAFTNDDETVLRIAHYSRTAIAQCAVADKPFVFLVQDTALLGEPIRLRKPIVMNQYDDPAVPRKRTPPGHVPLQRYLALPVFDGSHIVAVVGVGNKKAPYTAQDVTQLTLLMDGMWSILCRKEAEEELRTKEKRFRTLVANIPGVVFRCEVKPPWRVYYCSPAASEVSGYPASDFAGGQRTYPSLVHPDDLPLVEQTIAEAVTQRRPFVIEHRLGHADGSLRWVHARGQTTYDSGGTPLWLDGVILDVSERKQAEYSLRETAEHHVALNQLQQDLLGPSPLSEKLTKITNAAVRLFDVDFCRIWVIKPGDLCASGCVHADVTAGPHTCKHRDRCLHLVSSSGRYTHLDGAVHRRVPFGCYKIGRVASGEEHRFLTNDATTDPRVHNHEWAMELGLVSFAGYRLRPPGGETLGVLALFSRHTITPEIDVMLESLANTATQVILSALAEEEQRNLQGQLLQAQRLESVGQLAAGIAHEINTPTQFVSDNTRFLRGAFPKLAELLTRYRELAQTCRSGPVAAELLDGLDAAVKTVKLDYLLVQIPEALSDSLEGLERVTRIVRAMKDFAHPGQESLAPADLNKAIESTVTVARNEWKYVADMKLDLDPALPPVPCLLADFNQVILNIVVNAAHAIKDVIGDAGQGKGTITITTRGAGDHAEVRIADTGAGIPEQHRSRIFDQFFTTKQVGQGTGQGLAIARRVIVEKHHGTLTFETETGKGTTFVIGLPLEPDAGAATENPENELAPCTAR